MSMTVLDWIEHWLAAYDSQTSRPSTVQTHGYLLRNHVIPVMGHVCLEQLTEEVIRSSLMQMQDKPLGESTMRNISSLLHKCLQQAVEDGLLNANPVPVGLYRRKDSVRAGIMSQREISDYLRAAAQQRRLPMFHLLLHTGIKVGELVGLQWHDLDVRRQTLTVQGQRKRTISLDEETVSLLRREHAGHSNKETLFVHPGSLKPYTRGEIYRYHCRITEQCALNGTRLCDLRHTFAVHALQSGMPPASVAAILGHDRGADLLRIYRAYLPKKAPKTRKKSASQTNE